MQTREATHNVGHGFPTIVFPPLWAYEVCIFVRLKAAIANNTSLTMDYRSERYLPEITQGAPESLALPGLFNALY
jgi:hypothetical protein